MQLRCYIDTLHFYSVHVVAKKPAGRLPAACQLPASCSTKLERAGSDDPQNRPTMPCGGPSPFFNLLILPNFV